MNALTLTAPAVRYTATRRPHKCGPKCIYAAGPDCSCACGGKNHGRGYPEQLERAARDAGQVGLFDTLTPQEA